MGLNTTPRTWVAGEKPAASIWNAEIRDAFTGIQAAWTAYTPTWTATSTNPVLSDGTITGKYRQIGKTIEFYAQITMGGSTTFGSGAWIVGLPVAELTSVKWAFSGMARDVSTSQNFPAKALSSVAAPAGTVQILCDSTTAGATLRSVSGTVPFTWAVSDTLYIAGTYEAA